MSIFEVFLLATVLLIGTSIIYSTLRVGISPMPSSKKAYTAMQILITETGSGPIYDLGSGWGNLVIRLAKQYPERQIVGYELSFFPWLCSSLAKKVLGLKNLNLYREDFLQADLFQAEVLCCYLFPKTMDKLKTKIKQNNGQLKFIISNNFALPSYHACKTLQIDDFYNSPVYLYAINQDSHMR